MNAACLECLRDVDLEKPMTAQAAGKDKMKHTRFCDTFLGEEYGRLHSWGTVRSNCKLEVYTQPTLSFPDTGS